MYERDYVLTRRLPGMTVAQALERVRAALAAEGFGVLTEIDIQATLKQKLGVDRKPYVILGACNPPLAHRALEVEPPIGVFLPCNVDVFEGDDDATWVQTPRPAQLFRMIGKPEIEPLADEVDARLRRVLAAL